MEYKNVTQKLTHLNYLKNKYPEYTKTLTGIEKMYGGD